MRIISSNLRIYKKLLSLKLVRNISSKFVMEIQTFIFVDSETTGLPSQEYNRTKITELCFTIVQSEHIKLGVFPRVQHKLKLCFNPCKAISQEATALTGLSNDLLEHQPRFQQDSFNVISDFLNLQKKPVCLVAHNGNCFDYPILRAEIDKTGCELSDDVLCVDSLQAFRELHSISNGEQKVEDDLVGQINDGLDIHDAPTQKFSPVEFSDGYDELIFNAVEEFEKSTEKENIKNIQRINETTPNKKCKFDSTKYSSSITPNNGQTINDSYYMATSSNTLTNPRIPGQTSNNGTFNSSLGTNSNRSKVNGNALMSSKRSLHFRRPSFKLCDVYTRLTNKDPVNSHSAEHDVAMLIECAATLGQHFTDWANMNAKKFSAIPMMKPGKKLGT